MWPLMLAATMLLCGGLATYMIYYVTEEEYSSWYWLCWGITLGGLLVLIAHFSPLRSSYLVWSSIIGLLLTVTFLAGKTDEEYLPSAWVGVGILGANLLLFLLGVLVPTPGLAMVFVLLAVGLIYLGYRLRAADEHYYDAAYSASAICLVVALLCGTLLIKTPLEELNYVAIPRLNQLIETARARTGAYDSALQQAQQYRAQIDQQFGDEDAAYLDMVDQHIQAAAQHNGSARQLLDQAGQPEGQAAAYSAELAALIQTRTEHVTNAVAEAQAGLDQLNGVQGMFERLASEWVKEYLWFEVDGYWRSESDEYAAYDVCYYGERVSTRNGDSTEEQVISDEVDRTGSESFFGSDNEGLDWKYFTVADYNEMVNAGLIPAANHTIDSDAEAGIYLCGSSPQTNRFGVLGEPPVVIEKEYGSLTREIGDEGASFVGNYRYGTWCTVTPNAPPTPIPEEQQPPPDAQWCWHQKPGDSTQYYWERRLDGGGYIWIRSHRRCIYCTTQSSWGGGELVPDIDLARMHGTDGSSIRGPADQGGGPGTGK